jgi:predicted DNA binding protein
MRFLDATFKVQHDCPFCNLSAQFPDVTMALWCNGHNDLFEIEAADPEDIGRIVEASKHSLGLKEVVREGASAMTPVRSCHCGDYPSIDDIAERTDCWMLQPSIYRSGWETHRVFAPSKASLQRFVSQARKVAQVEMTSLRPRDRLDALQSAGLVPVHLFQGLTDRQVQVLVAAYESGALDVPAKNGIDHLARTLALSRSTCGEHLRKSMLYLVRNAYPLLKLYDEGKRVGTPNRKPE